jgi:hypothetical protein
MRICVQKFDAFIAKCGIQQQTTALYSPKQIVVTKCANRTIMDCAKSIILAQRLELEFLGRSNEHGGVHQKSMSNQGS